MWPRRTPKEEGCRELGKVLREALETSGAERYEDFLASAEPPVREHVMICEGCRAELSDALLVRRLLRGNVPATADPGRIFSTRVMNAIAEEEFRGKPGAEKRMAHVDEVHDMIAAELCLHGYLPRCAGMPGTGLATSARSAGPTVRPGMSGSARSANDG